MSFVEVLPIELSQLIFGYVAKYCILCRKVCKSWAKTVTEVNTKDAPLIIYESIATGNVSVFEYIGKWPTNHDNNVCIAAKDAITHSCTEVLAHTLDLKYGYKMWYMVARIVVDQCHALSGKVPDVVEQIPECTAIKRSLWIIAARANNYYFIERTLQLIRDDSCEKNIMVETIARVSNIRAIEWLLETHPELLKLTGYYCMLMAASLSPNHPEMSLWIQLHNNVFLDDKI